MPVFNLLGGSCHLCGSLLSGQLDACADCRAELPWLHAACRHCAEPLFLPAGQRGICGQCQVAAPAIAQIESAFRYRYPLDRLVQRFKFERNLEVGQLLATLFADEMTRRIQEKRVERPMLLLPVPLHPRRERERGFNQAVILARTLEKRLEIPMSGELLRTRDTPVQSGLDRKTRRRNLRGAFRVTGNLPTHVAIVDDVSTTGSTLAEIAGLLARHGVQRVDAWVLAKTPRDRD